MKLWHYTSIFLGSFVTYKCVHVLFKYYKHWRFFRSFPQTNNIFYFGCSLDKVNKDDKFTYLLKYSENFSKYRYFVYWRAMFPVVVLHHPDAIKEICMSTKAINKDYWPFDALIGNGLVCLNGDKWRKHRKLLTSSFHTEVMESFICNFTQHGEDLVDNIIDFKGQEFDFYQLIVKCTFDVLLETLMGLNMKTFDAKEKQAFLDSVRNSAKLTLDYAIMSIFIGKWIARWTRTGRGFWASVGRQNAFMRKVLKNRMEVLRKNPEILEKDGPLMLLDRLIQLKLVHDEFTDEDITNELSNFLFAGYDTTTSSLSWAMHLLANHPEVQKKLTVEIRTVAKEKNLIKENAIKISNNSDLSHFTFLDAVIKESQRLYNAVTVVSRKMDKESHFRLPKAASLEDPLTDDKTEELPIGCGVALLQSALHRNKNVWGPDAEEFRPERFLDGSAPTDPFAYIPFSAGPRNCIGQRFALIEMKCILIHLFNKLNFTTWQSFSDCKPVRGATLDPTNGVQLKANLI